MVNIVLFALTGLGNSVLRALAEIGQRPSLVVTRQETGIYPYYDETQLRIDAGRLKIPLLIGEEGEKEAIRLRPDVLFSATYHRLISNDVIAAAGQAFNLHPSLLPSYPGKNPFYWVLINGESATGVSIHRLTDRFDAGEIVMQRKAAIQSDETQGSLRLKLALLAGEMTKEFCTRLDSSNFLPVLGRSSEKGCFSQVTDTDRMLDLKNSAEMICRQVRALTPWPRAILRETGGTVQKVTAVEYSSLSNIPSGAILFANETTATVRVADAEITFSIDGSAKVENR